MQRRVFLNDLLPIPERPFKDDLVLHPDVLRLIITRLPFEDLIQTQLVCRRLQAVVRSKDTWKLYFNARGIEVPEQLEKVLSSPTASGYFLRAHRRISMFMKFCNTDYKFGVSVHNVIFSNSSYNTTAFSMRDFNPWKKQLLLSGQSSTRKSFDGQFQDLAAWVLSNFSDYAKKINHSRFCTSFSESADERLYFFFPNTLDFEEGRTFKFGDKFLERFVHLDDLCDGFLILADYDDSLIVPEIMLVENDKVFLKRLFDTFETVKNKRLKVYLFR